MADFESLTDEELVGIVCDQDQERYTDLVKRYEAKLLRYAIRFTHDEDRAQDAVQNALIKAFVNLKGFNRKKKFSSWIYRIVHNETINELKKNKKEIPLETSSAQFQESDVEHPDDTIDKATEAAQLHEVLDDIPLSYRSPLILFFFEDKTYEDISDILHMPVETVGTRINRGKKLLRELYEKKHR